MFYAQLPITILNFDVHGPRTVAWPAQKFGGDQNV